MGGRKKGRRVKGRKGERKEGKGGGWEKGELSSSNSTFIIWFVN